MANRSAAYEDIGDQELARRKGLVECLRDRRRHLTRQKCREILACAGWDLGDALRVADLLAALTGRKIADQVE